MSATTPVERGQNDLSLAECELESLSADDNMIDDFDDDGPLPFHPFLLLGESENPVEEEKKTPPKARNVPSRGKDFTKVTPPRRSPRRQRNPRYYLREVAQKEEKKIPHAKLPNKKKAVKRNPADDIIRKHTRGDRKILRIGGPVYAAFPGTHPNTDQWYWGKILDIEEKQGQRRYKVRYVDNDVSPSFLRPSAVFSLRAAVKILPHIKPPAEFLQEQQDDEDSGFNNVANDGDGDKYPEDHVVDLTKEEGEDSGNGGRDEDDEENTDLRKSMDIKTQVENDCCIDLTSDHDDEEKKMSPGIEQEMQPCSEVDTSSPDESTPDSSPVSMGEGADSMNRDEDDEENTDLRESMDIKTQVENDCCIDLTSDHDDEESTGLQASPGIEQQMQTCSEVDTTSPDESTPDSSSVSMGEGADNINGDDENSDSAVSPDSAPISRVASVDETTSHNQSPDSTNSAGEGEIVPNLAWANAYRQAHIALEHDREFERAEKAKEKWFRFLGV